MGIQEKYINHIIKDMTSNTEIHTTHSLHWMIKIHGREFNIHNMYANSNYDHMISRYGIKGPEFHKIMGGFIDRLKKTNPDIFE